MGKGISNTDNLRGSVISRGNSGYTDPEISVPRVCEEQAVRTRRLECGKET